jgi:hypothetical protein
LISLQLKQLPMKHLEVLCKRCNEMLVVQTLLLRLKMIAQGKMQNRISAMHKSMRKANEC